MHDPGSGTTLSTHPAPEPSQQPWEVQGVVLPTRAGRGHRTGDKSCVWSPHPHLLSPGTHLLLGPTASQAHQVLPSSVAVLGEATGGPQGQLPLDVGRQGLSAGDLSRGLGPPGREGQRGQTEGLLGGEARTHSPQPCGKKTPPSITPQPFCFGPHAFPSQWFF